MRALALTFDDGPDQASTPRLLDLLQRVDGRATFFPIAPRAAAHPTLIRRMLAGGHVVGVHCDEHVRHSTREASWGRLDTRRAISRLHALGVQPELWRTPWGDLAPWTRPLADELGLRLVGWTVDTHDWRGDSAGEMFRATRPHLTDGAVVLAHDGIGPGARRTNAEQTVAYAGLVIDHVRRQGLTLRTLA